ncbi:MAG: DNA recombination protein RmuC [Chitinophagaceae bacterium]
MSEILITLLVTFTLTSLITWWFTRNITSKQAAILAERLSHQVTASATLQANYNNLNTENAELSSRATRAESRNELLEDYAIKYNQLRGDYTTAQSQLSALKENLKSAEEKLAGQKQELQEIGEKFRFEFRNLAQTILEEKSEKFTQVNEEKLKAILDPLKLEIGTFKQKVEETYDKESKERFSLGKEVQRLIEMSQAVSIEANNLTSALKGNNKIQGNWGEMILESLLENSGLTKGREYFVQEFIRDNAGNVIKDENGQGLQPDIIISYPDQRKVVIDSKVSLLSWDECNTHESKAEQQRCLLDHIRSLRSHIDGLSRKNYPKYATALDYVLLFIPIEPAFLEAVKTDTLLWKYAYDRKILLVSPTNLFVVLRIISDLWRVEQRNRNANEIADKAGLLYDKFTLFVDNLELVGKKLSDANTAYDQAYKQLSTGKGNIITKVEELRKMGADAKKQLPDRLLTDL